MMDTVSEAIQLIVIFAVVGCFAYLFRPSTWRTTASGAGNIADDDAKQELRRLQDNEDAFQQRQSQRKADQALRQRRLLEYALAHPYTREGARHLDETLQEQARNLEHANIMITNAEFWLSRKDRLSSEEHDKHLEQYNQSISEKARAEEVILAIEIARQSAPPDARAIES